MADSLFQAGVKRLNASLDSYVDLQAVKQRLERRYALIPDVLPGGGPARCYRLGGSETRIGFITPLSQHFCATCNRVRLAVDGTLYPCLGQEDHYPLRPLLRAGVSDAHLVEHLRHPDRDLPHLWRWPGRIPVASDPNCCGRGPELAAGRRLRGGGLVGAYLGARCQRHIPQAPLKALLAIILLGLAACYLWLS